MNPTGELTVQVQGQGRSRWISHIAGPIRGRKDSHSPGAEGTQDLSLNHCLGHTRISKLMDACSPDEGRVLRPRRQGPCRWSGPGPGDWGSRIRVRLGPFSIRVEHPAGGPLAGQMVIRPSISSDPLAAGVGGGSTGRTRSHGPRPCPEDPVPKSHPEGTDQPNRGSGDRRVPPPLDLELVPGQKRPG